MLAHFHLVLIWLAWFVPAAVVAEETISNKPFSVWESQLNSKDLVQRREAIGALASSLAMRDRAVTVLIAHYDKEPVVEARSQVLSALNRLRPTAVCLPVFKKAVEEESTLLRGLGCLFMARLPEQAKEIVPILVRVLGEDSDKSVRRYAASSLGAMTSVAEKVLPELLQYFSHPHLSVRTGVREGLIKLKGHLSLKSVPALLDGFRGPRALNKSPLIADLIASVGRDAIPLLEKALTHVNAFRVSGALLALENLKEKAKPSLVKVKPLLKDRRPLVAIGAARVLWKINGPSEEVFEPFLQGLKGSPTVRIRATNAIRAMGTGPLKMIAKMLKEGVLPRRALALVALSAMSEKQAVGVGNAIIEATVDKELLIRKRAVRIILGWKQYAVSPLVKALKDPKPEIRLSAAKMIAVVHPSQLRSQQKALMKAMEDRNPLVRLYAATGLGRATGQLQDIIGIVAPSLDVKNPEERRAAVQAVAGLKQTMIRASQPFGSTVRKLLTGALDDKSVIVRVTAASGFLPAYDSGDREPYCSPGLLVPIFKEGITCHDAEARLLASRGLMLLEGRSLEALPGLIEGLKDPDLDVRKNAVFTFRFFGSKGSKAVAEVIPLLKDRGRYCRILAAQALGSIGPDAAKAVDELTKKLRLRDITLRFAAIEALGRIGPKAEAAVPALLKRLPSTDRSTLKVGSVRYQAEHGPAPLPYPNRTEQEMVLEALGRIGPGAKKALPLLSDLLAAKEVEHPQMLTWIIGRMGEPAPLLKGVGHVTSRIQKLCLRELIGISLQPNDIQKLQQTLKSTDVEIQQLVVDVLASQGAEAKDVTATLRGLWSHAKTSEELRPSLLSAMGAIDPNHRAHQQIFLDAVKGTNPLLRQLGARALRHSRRTDALTLLFTRLLNDPDSYVRWEAAQALQDQPKK